MTRPSNFQVKMKLRILSKRERTRRERVLTLTTETKELASKDKSLKVCTCGIALHTQRHSGITKLARNASGTGCGY